MITEIDRAIHNYGREKIVLAIRNQGTPKIDRATRNALAPLTRPWHAPVLDKTRQNPRKTAYYKI